MSVGENSANINFIYGGMRDRSMRSRTKLAREIQLTDWSTAGNLSNRSSGVQILRDICTRFGRYLYSTKCSWIINVEVFCRSWTFCFTSYQHKFTPLFCLPAPCDEIMYTGLTIEVVGYFSLEELPQLREKNKIVNT